MYEEGLSRFDAERWIVVINTQNKTLILNGIWETIAKKTVPIGYKILKKSRSSRLREIKHIKLARLLKAMNISKASIIKNFLQSSPEQIPIELSLLSRPY